MVSFFSQEFPNANVAQNISNSCDDVEFPIVGNGINRKEIYAELWTHLSGALTTRFSNHDKYNFPGLSTATTVSERILSLTQIVAFALSKKKPSGLASKSNNDEKQTGNNNDPILNDLKKYLNNLKDIKPSSDLIEFYPEFENDFSTLKNDYEKIVSKYEKLKSRNIFFSDKVIDAIHGLRFNPDQLEDFEIRQLIKDSLSHFGKKYDIHNDYASLKSFFTKHIDYSELHESGKTIRFKNIDQTKSENRKIEEETMDKITHQKEVTFKN